MSKIMHIKRSLQDIDTSNLFSEQKLHELMHQFNNEHLVDVMPLTTQHFDFMWLKDQTFGPRRPELPSGRSKSAGHHCLRARDACHLVLHTEFGDHS